MKRPRQKKSNETRDHRSTSSAAGPSRTSVRSDPFQTAVQSLIDPPTPAPPNAPQQPASKKACPLRPVDSNPAAHYVEARRARVVVRQLPQCDMLAFFARHAGVVVRDLDQDHREGNNDDNRGAR